MDHDAFLPVSRLSDAELLARTRQLARGHARLNAVLIAHLAEVDARRLYASEGFSSLYAYCRSVLNLSEAAAFHRIEAARVARRFPLILGLMSEGRLHLTAVSLLGRHLTAENHERALRNACGRSKREVEQIVALLVSAGAPATLRGSMLEGREESGMDPPAPAGPGVAGSRPLSARVGVRVRLRTPEGLRPLRGPGRPRRVARGATQGAESARSAQGAQCALPLFERRQTSEDGGGRAEPHSRGPETAGDTPPPARGVALEYRLTIGLDADAWRDLERARELLRPTIPDGDLGRVLTHALRVFINGRDRRRLGRARPTTPASRGSEPTHRTAADARKADARPSRHVPAPIRRLVWERDAGRCAYMAESGRRCDCRTGLEFHHRTPFRAGGRPTPENLELRCRTHNRLAEAGELSEWRGVTRTGK